MRTASYIWQLNKDYPGADPDDTHLPISSVWFKTHDGVTWMGQIYHHPAAPVSSASVTHLVQIYAAQGIDFLPWCVPTAENIPEEANRACEVLAGLEAAGVPLRLAFDFEVDTTPNFWKGTTAQAIDLIHRVRTRYPAAQLTLTYYQYSTFAAIVSLFDTLSTMDYWNDFGNTPEDQLQASYDRLTPLNKPIVYGIPGNAEPVMFQRGLDWLKAHGGPPYVAWRRGTTRAENWTAIASFNMEDHPAAFEMAAPESRGGTAPVGQLVPAGRGRAGARSGAAAGSRTRSSGRGRRPS
jgi:hypothetical protein